MSSLPPPVLTREARTTKGQRAPDAALVLQYHHLLHVVPDPEVPSSKPTWESRMYHACAIFRGAFVCEEEGGRRVLHNHILKTFDKQKPQNCATFPNPPKP